MSPECRNCGDEAYARGRCRLCYVYFRKHGTERPEEVWIAYNRRVIEGRLSREAYGPFYALVNRL